MGKQIVVTKAGEGDSLNVMGGQVRFICSPEKTDKQFSLMEVLVPKHAGPPAHDHPWDEAYYVLSGAVRFTVEGEEQVVRAGDFLYAPAGTVHGFSGELDEPSRMLIIDSPGHAEAFFRDVDHEVKGPEDMPKIPQIAERNQIYFRQQ